MLAAAVGAGEERILAVERDRTDRAFDDVGVDLDAAVVEEAGQAVPARERIADRLGELGLLADQAELGAQPGLECIEDAAGSSPAGARAAPRRCGRGCRSRWRRARRCV